MTSIIQQIISNEILDKTMHVFWEKGYFNVSLDDLIEATGFNRSAIYKYFGNKRGLFIAMLKRYRQEITPKLTAPLQNTSEGLQAIEKFFTQFSNLNKKSAPRGCFLIATASDLPSHDKEIAVFIDSFSNQVRTLFLACLTHASNEKLITKKIDIKAVADFLTANIFGLMTLHRAQATPETIKHQTMIIRYFLNTISLKRDTKRWRLQSCFV